MDLAPSVGTVIRQTQVAVVEARAAAFALGRLAYVAPPALAWRCDRVSRVIIDVLRESFGDGVL